MRSMIVLLLAVGAMVLSGCGMITTQRLDASTAETGNTPSDLVRYGFDENDSPVMTGVFVKNTPFPFQVDAEGTWGLGSSPSSVVSIPGFGSVFVPVNATVRGITRTTVDEDGNPVTVGVDEITVNASDVVAAYDAQVLSIVDAVKTLGPEQAKVQIEAWRQAGIITDNIADAATSIVSRIVVPVP